MKLKYEIREYAACPKLVTRSDWKLAATAFTRSTIAGVQPVSAAVVLDVGWHTRKCMESLIAKTPTELAALVCGLLAERRIPKRRKGGAS